MSAVMQSPKDIWEEEFQQLKEATPYPNGIYYWREFVAQFRNLPEAPFAIMLQKVPGRYELLSHISLHHSQETFFGIMCERSDGRLGKLCFGRASKDFGGDESSLCSSIFIEDGFSHSFLHTSVEGFMKTFGYKIVGVHTERDRVILKLLEWVKRIADDKAYCPRTEPEAANLIRLYRHLQRFLKFCQDSKHSAELDLVHDVIKVQLEAWASKLESQLADLEERGAFLRHQVSLIRG